MVGTTDMLVHDVIVHSLPCRHNELVPYGPASLDMAEGGDGHSLWRTLRYHYLFKVYMPVYRLLGCQAGHIPNDTAGQCRILSEEEYMKKKSETMGNPQENGNGKSHEIKDTQSQIKGFAHQNGLRKDQNLYRFQKGRSYRQRKLRSFEKARLSCHNLPIPEEPEYEQSETETYVRNESESRIESDGTIMENSVMMENPINLKRRSLENDHWDKVVSKRMGLFSSELGSEHLSKEMQQSKSCPSLQRVLNSEHRKRSNSSPLRSGFLYERNYPNKSSKYSFTHETQCICGLHCGLPVNESKDGGIPRRDIPNKHVPQSVSSSEGESCLCDSIRKQSIDSIHQSPIGDMNHNYEVMSCSTSCSDSTQKSNLCLNDCCGDLKCRLISQPGSSRQLDLKTSDIAQSSMTSQSKEMPLCVTSPICDASRLGDATQCDCLMQTNGSKSDIKIINQENGIIASLCARPTENLSNDIFYNPNPFVAICNGRNGLSGERHKMRDNVVRPKSGSTSLMTTSCIEFNREPNELKADKSRPKSEHFELPGTSSSSSFCESLAMKSKYLETNPLLNIKRCRSETNLKGEVIRTKLEDPSSNSDSESDSDNEADDLIQRYRKRKIRNHRKLDLLLGFQTGCCLGEVDRLGNDVSNRDWYSHRRPPNGCHLLGCKMCRVRYQHCVLSITKSDSDHLIYSSIPNNKCSSMPKYAHSLQDIESKANRFDYTNQPVILRRKTYRQQQQRQKINSTLRYSCPLPVSNDVTSGCNVISGEGTHHNVSKPLLSSQSCMCFQSQKNDRQEILRKLAMAPEEEPMVFDADKALKKSNVQTRFQHGHGLQVCFMNEQMVPAQPNQTQHAPKPETATSSDKIESAPPTKEKVPQESEADLKTRQQRLQHEATIALAQVRPMAHMQLMVEKEQKQKQKKSPLAEIVGIPGLGDDKILELTHDMLKVMNVAQLQVVLNDLHSQIESLNMELMNQLVERDDLHMEQDSMLVDIEDLHRRAEELSLKVSSSILKSPKKKRDKKK